MLIDISKDWETHLRLNLSSFFELLKSMQVERWAHTRSKHLTVEGGKTSSKSSKSKQIPTYVTEESVYALIREIGKKLAD